MEILQPGVGPIDAATYLPADPAAVFWGRSPCADDAPVLEVDAGAEVTIDTISHEGVLADQGSDPRAFFAEHGVPADRVLTDAIRLAAERTRDADDGPHVLTGPVGVRGATPGDLLAVDILRLRPRAPYGVISNRHGRGALPGEYPRGGAEVVSIFARVDDPAPGRVDSLDGEAYRSVLPTPTASIARAAESDARISFPLAPFLGTIGVAVPGSERPHSVPPGHHGGNIDIKLLVEGTTLYLPVLVPGAGVYVGDPHFAQGDGEVALTALEAPLRATLRLRVIRASDPLAVFVHEHGPVVETAEYWVPTGMDPDLGEAMRRAVRASIALLVDRHGMDPEHAYAYLSAATDFDISQVVDRTTGVHARIRKADLDGTTGGAA